MNSFKELSMFYLASNCLQLTCMIYSSKYKLTFLAAETKYEF
jgi:hypothetical protein